MGKTVIDLSNFKDRVGGRVAPGRYRVQVEDVEEVKTRNGDAMFNLFLRVIGGEFDGQTLVDRLVQTENALFRTVNFLQGIGHPTPRKRLSVDTSAWVGKVVEVDVDDGEPYRGTIRSEVRGYEKVSKSEKKDDFEELPDSEDADGSEDAEAEEPAQSEPEAATESESEDKPEPKKKPKKADADQQIEETSDSGDIDLEEVDL